MSDQQHPSGLDTAASGMITYSAKQMRRAREVLSRIYAMRRVVRMFPLDNPVVAESVASLMDSVMSFHDEGVDVVFAFFEGEILLGEQILTEESVMFDQLVRDLAAIGIGSLAIKRGVTADELARAIGLMAMEADEVERQGGMQQLIAQSNLEHVDLGEVRVIEKAEEVTGDPAEEARAAYNGAVSLLREMDRLLRTNRSMSAGKVKGAVRSLVDNVLSNRDAMLQLTGLKDYDEYTFYHSANVAILSLALGSTVTTNYRFLSSLGVGALMHDLGKLAVDLEILNKPGALSPEEWAHVRLHPGARCPDVVDPAGRGQGRARHDPRAPHAVRRLGLPQAQPVATPAPGKPHRRGGRLLRRDDVSAKLLGGAGSGRGDAHAGPLGGLLARPRPRPAVHHADGRVPASIGGSALDRRGRDRARSQPRRRSSARPCASSPIPTAHWSNPRTSTSRPLTTSPFGHVSTRG